MRKIQLAVVALLGAFAAVGCSNLGDTNPVSPEKMVEIRNQQMKDRENFKPDTNSPGGAPTGGSRPAGR